MINFGAAVPCPPTEAVSVVLRAACRACRPIPPSLHRTS